MLTMLTTCAHVVLPIPPAVRGMKEGSFISAQTLERYINQSHTAYADYLAARIIVNAGLLNKAEVAKSAQAWEVKILAEKVAKCGGVVGERGPASARGSDRHARLLTKLASQSRGMLLPELGTTQFGHHAVPCRLVEFKAPFVFICFSPLS